MYFLNFVQLECGQSFLIGEHDKEGFEVRRVALGIAVWGKAFLLWGMYRKKDPQDSNAACGSDLVNRCIFRGDGVGTVNLSSGLRIFPA